MTVKDIFINATLLFENIGATLDNVESNLTTAKLLTDNLQGLQWLPERAQCKAGCATKEIEKAKKGIDSIIAFIREGAKSRRMTKTIVDTEGRKRTERISVIRGGLYKPPVEKPKDCLTDEFKAFLAEERQEVP